MKYRKLGNTGKEVSALGFGMMRLPLIDPSDSRTIEEKASLRMVREAIEGGINYFDTAWPYHGGESETFLGKALKGTEGKGIYVASKCPVWEMEKPEDFERTLDIQLGKLGREQIDFYLLHALGAERWETVQRLELLHEMEKAREKGKIGHIGFSFHDKKEVYEEILRSYDWDFCQLQMNYIDVDFQSTIEGVYQAAEKGMGVVIMEPLRGGRLASPPPAVRNILGEKSPVQWAMDFLWTMPQVSLLLSGMSTSEQLKENLSFASQAQVGKLSEQDLELLKEAKHVYEKMSKVPCTSCEYCLPCPFELNIPGIFEVYNATALSSREKQLERYQSLEKTAADCTACGNCAPQCPQAIAIPEEMERIHNYFEKEK